MLYIKQIKTTMWNTWFANVPTIPLSIESLFVLSEDGAKFTDDGSKVTKDGSMFTEDGSKVREDGSSLIHSTVSHPLSSSGSISSFLCFIDDFFLSSGGSSDSSSVKIVFQ